MVRVNVTAGGRNRPRTVDELLLQYPGHEGIVLYSRALEWVLKQTDEGDYL
jgi:hypothetical protein